MMKPVRLRRRAEEARAISPLVPWAAPSAGVDVGTLHVV